MNALNAEFSKHTDMILPPVWSHEWNWAVDGILEIENKKKRKFEAKMLACLLLNNKAWFNNASRKEYLDYIWSLKDRNEAVGSAVSRLFAIAGTGNDKGFGRFPALETLRQWYEDFDAPAYEDIDLRRGYFTPTEVAVIARHNGLWNVPYTTTSMRRYLNSKAPKRAGKILKRKRR